MANVHRGKERMLRREWRGLARLVLDGIAAGLIVSIALALAVFIVTIPAQASPAAGRNRARCT